MWPRGRAERATTGPTPARAHYAVMRRASRLRRWLLAGAVGEIIGAIVGMRLGWWLGSCAAAMIVAGLLIRDRHSGVLGTWPGDEGCHRLAAGAARMERHGWTVLRDPAIPNQGSGRIAYLLVGVGGVVVVRRTTVARAAAAAVDESLSDALSREIPVHPVLAVHALTIDRPRATVGVTILPITQLARVVMDSEVVLSTADVDIVAATARRQFTPGATP